VGEWAASRVSSRLTKKKKTQGDETERRNLVLKKKDHSREKVSGRGGGACAERSCTIRNENECQNRKR